MKVFVWYTINNKDGRTLVRLCDLDKGYCLANMLDKLDYLKLAYTVEKVSEYEYLVTYSDHTVSHYIAEFKEVENNENY